MKKTNLKNYLLLAGTLLLAYVVGIITPALMSQIGHTGDIVMTQVFLTLTLLFGFGYLANRTTEKTVIPSFVAILLLGILLQKTLAPLTQLSETIAIVATVFATLILYLGGIEIDRKSFLKIWFPTLVIAVVGYLITALTFGYMLQMIAQWMNIALSPETCYLLGAILGSTDPAALIPTLKGLVFKNKQLVDISIAESALNDVIGTVTTLILLAKLGAHAHFGSAMDVLSSLATSETLIHLGKEFLIGGIIGLISWLFINWYEKKKHSEAEKIHDIGLLLFVPVFAWLVATLFGGSGFLAAFVAGLMAQYGGHHEIFRMTSHQLESKIEVYAKPAIFMFLGPLVNLSELWHYAGIGILISIVFVLISRTLSVFVSLLPFAKKFKLNEMAFLCVVRETGVIPVVLLILTATQFPELQGLVPIGTWVVLFTLIVLPMITPWWAKVCKVLKD